MDTPEVFRNFSRLPFLHRRAVNLMTRRMVPDFDAFPVVEQQRMLGHDALRYRQARGWFVFVDGDPEAPMTPVQSPERRVAASPL